MADKELDELVERLKARGLTTKEVKQALLAALAALDSLPPDATDEQVDAANATAEAAAELAEEHARQHGLPPIEDDET